MPASRMRAKLGRSRLAVQVETNLELIAIEAKDAVVPVPGFGPFDEFNVDSMRLGFDVDVEDAFVSRLRRFRPKSVAIDEQARGCRRSSGNDVPVDFQIHERPGPLERSKLFHVA